MGSATSNLLKAAKILGFVIVALVLFFTGVIGTGALWRAAYSHYDNPNTGYYHGFVSASFLGKDGAFDFDYRGETEPVWYWRYPPSFAYPVLHYKWSSSESRARPPNGSGTLFLPSFTYESTNGSGTLTRSLLASWLLGTANSTAKGRQSVDAVFDSLEAAGKGTLPSPRHHSIEVPFGSMQHFRLGSGVPGILVAWVIIWLALVIFYARRLLKGNAARR